MGKNSVKISGLPLKVQLDIRRQLGDAHFDRVVSKEAKSGNKYRVGPPEGRTVDGILFASKFEARVYSDFKQRLGPGAFSMQPKFLLQEGFIDEKGKKHRAIYYVSDFLIGHPRGDDSAPLHPGDVVVEIKGFKTSEYRLKLKMFLARYKPRFFEVHSVSALDEVYRCLGNPIGLKGDHAIREGSDLSTGIPEEKQRQS